MDKIFTPLLNTHKYTFIVLYHIPNYNTITLIHKKLNISFTAVRECIVILKKYGLILTRKTGRVLNISLTSKGLIVLDNITIILNTINAQK